MSTRLTLFALVLMTLIGCTTPSAQKASNPEAKQEAHAAYVRTLNFGDDGLDIRAQQEAHPAYVQTPYGVVPYSVQTPNYSQNQRGTHKEVQSSVRSNPLPKFDFKPMPHPR